jgi:hypothetical protein
MGSRRRPSLWLHRCAQAAHRLPPFPPTHKFRHRAHTPSPPPPFSNLDMRTLTRIHGFAAGNRPGYTGAPKLPILFALSFAGVVYTLSPIIYPNYSPDTPFHPAHPLLPPGPVHPRLYMPLPLTHLTNPTPLASLHPPSRRPSSPCLSPASRGASCRRPGMRRRRERSSESSRYALGGGG